MKKSEAMLEKLFPVTNGIVGVGWHQISSEQKQEFIHAMECYALEVGQLIIDECENIATQWENSITIQNRILEINIQLIMP